MKVKSNALRIKTLLVALLASLVFSLALSATPVRSLADEFIEEAAESEVVPAAEMNVLPAAETDVETAELENPIGALDRGETALVEQALTVQLPSNYLSAPLGEPAPTGSYNSSPYSRWEHAITSFLHVNADGNPERVEYVGDQLVVEILSTDFHRLLSKRIVERSTYLPSNLASDDAFRWGGFYSGTRYNFVVTGQTNSAEDNNCVVFRVTTYDKSWNYIASTEFRGENTTVPFDASGCDFSELNNTLHVRTTHEMYTDSAGLNHEANVHITLDLSNFSGTAATDVSNQYQTIHGYVSHSFGVRLAQLNGTLYALDHGDAHPRSLTMKRYGHKYGGTIDIISFPGGTGENYTGLNMGGFESSIASNMLISTGVFVGLNGYELESWTASKPRNVYISVTPDSFDSSSSSTLRYLSSYPTSGQTGAGNAKLVKINENRFLVLWDVVEYAEWYGFSPTGSIGYVFVDGNGNTLSETFSADATLSEVKPLCIGNYVCWYAPDFDDGKRPVYYGIDSASGELRILSQVPLSEVEAAAIPAETFNFKAHTPKPSLSFQGSSLAEGTFWKLAGYEANVNAGTAKVKLEAVSGQKRFSGTRTLTFTINRLPISEASIADIAAQTYTGSALTPVPKISYSGNTLVQGTDFSVSYKNNVNVGSASATITGIGNFSGSAQKTFTIQGDLSSSFASIARIADRTYNGKEQKPTPSVSFAGSTLTLGTDFTVSYKNNVNAGTASVTVTGKGLYKGSKSASFTIKPLSLAKATVTAATQTYTGSALTPSPSVTLNGVTLKAGTAFTTSYSNNTNAGTATVTVSGKGNYTSTASARFTIKPASIAKATVKAADQTWTGKALTPAPTVTLNGKTLTSKTDYSVSYKNNVEPGSASVTVTARGNYTGSASGTFTIKPQSLAQANISGLTNKTYTGAAHTPKPTVTFKGTTLILGTDYTLSYKNNVNAGTATVVVSGKGHYKDSASANFTIAPLSLDGFSLSEIPTQAWTGKQITPEPKVSSGKTVLVKDRDYTLSYAKNIEPGTASLTVTGIGNYKGTLKGSFEIKCKIVPMYRLYNPNSGEHFYTASAYERDVLKKAGWRYEGIGWYAPEWSRTPVYRLYNKNAGDHHYTTSKAERDMLIGVGWRYEGIGWYSDDAKGVPLYRQYNPNARTGTHNYTTNKAENDWLVSLGWRAEGIGWYGVKK